MRRREFLQATGLFALTGLARARGAAPQMVASGDVRADRAVLWAAGDRRARMLVEWSTRPDFKHPHRVKGPVANAGLTAQVGLDGLPAGQTVHYRVRFDEGPWATGSLRTPGEKVRFVWGADVVGQGWGIDPSHGGLQSFASMRALQPDFMVHVGDSIYADSPVSERVQLDDGSWWTNLVTPAKAHVAQTLEDFRGCYRYNFQDAHYREFMRRVPVAAIWSDHEVRDNWWPAQQPLSVPGGQAFREFWPLSTPRLYRSLPYGPDLEVFMLDLRSFRGPNDTNDSHFLGRAQLDWLKSALARSPATWKVIATEIPIAASYTPRWGLDGWSNGNGPAAGRELELAELLSFLKKHGIQNTLWVTGDVHYGAALSYEPDRAQHRDFLPFWEFIAGPLHAGTYAPTDPLDNTFGPKMEFCAVPSTLKPNRPPSEGLQFFGMVEVEGRRLTVTLHNRSGQELYLKNFTAS